MIDYTLHQFIAKYDEDCYKMWQIIKHDICYKMRRYNGRTKVLEVEVNISKWQVSENRVAKIIFTNSCLQIMFGVNVTRSHNREYTVLSEKQKTCKYI